MELLNFKKLFGEHVEDKLGAPHTKFCESLVSDILYSYLVQRDLDDEDLPKHEAPLSNLLWDLLFKVPQIRNIANAEIHTYRILNEMSDIVDSFKFGEVPVGYGSTCIVVRRGPDIIKRYKKLSNIFLREARAYERLMEPVTVDIENLTIEMPFFGESLYHNFKLPQNWKKQVRAQLDYFDSVGIYYPEFNLKNILVTDDGEDLIFIDFGLVEFDIENKNAPDVFINFISALEEKFIKVTNCEERQVLYLIFMNNLKMDKVTSEWVF